LGARQRRRGARSETWNAIEIASLRFAVALLGVLPHRASLRLGAALAAFYGFLGKLFGMRQYSVAKLNLEIAFPEKTQQQRDAILSSMWRQWGMFAVDAVQLAKITPERLRELVAIDPPERIPEIEGKMKENGVLILSAHFGSFELLLAAVGAYGHPISLVHRPMANPRVEVWIEQMRARFGTRQLPKGAAARDIIRELRAGRPVAIPFDQMGKRTTRVFAPFFGVQASTNSGLARLALLSKAPVYPVVIVRDGSSMKHRALFGPEVPIARTGDVEADVLENSRRFNRVLEELIREHPDHWIWMYRRFKQQPEGTPSPYEVGAWPPEKYRMAAPA